MTASWYRIYEVIDITKTLVNKGDIIVKIKNQNILKKMDEGKRVNARQRILSVLDMRKMFPVDERVYREIKFNISNDNEKVIIKGLF